jgi:N utilization substance protein A
MHVEETTMGRIKRDHDELGPDAAGQSGDTQQLNNTPEADSESVEELIEEGNAFEADAVQGVEDADDPDVSEVRTRQVPEDDVPLEYLDDEDKDVA